MKNEHAIEQDAVHKSTCIALRGKDAGGTFGDMRCFSDRRGRLARGRRSIGGRLHSSRGRDIGDHALQNNAHAIEKVGAGVHLRRAGGVACKHDFS